VLKKEYDKAIKDYDEALRLDPRYAQTFYERGLAWRNKKDYDKAIKDYDEAIRLDPKYATAFYGRGIARALKKEYEKAIKDYDDAIRLSPKYAFAFRERAVAHGNLKEYARALADYEAAVRIDPKYAAALADQAWLLATCSDARFRDGKKAVTASAASLRVERLEGPHAPQYPRRRLRRSGRFQGSRPLANEGTGISQLRQDERGHGPATPQAVRSGDGLSPELLGGTMNVCWIVSCWKPAC